MRQEGVEIIPSNAKKVFAGLIFGVWQWEQKLYDGSTATFEALRREDAAHTVAVLPGGKILLNEDEQPHRQSVLTPPGGRLDLGETPEEAARREFLEETGYEVGTLIPWHTYQPSGKIEFTVHVFIGRNLKKIGEPDPGAGERVHPMMFTFDEFLALGHSAHLRDLVIRIILLEALLDTKKRNDLHQLLYGRPYQTT